MSKEKSDFKHVNYEWDEAHAATLSPVERLVYRSNILGSDQRITNTGGGNTSSKVKRDRSAQWRVGRSALGQRIRR
jgi:rhamnose utilization protein RhaD (predicted bifunctional aldolase and dehydrogenase)